MSSNFIQERKVERIYDYPKNDSRMPISYIVVNNDSLGGGGFGEVFLVKKENIGEQPEDQTLFAMKRIKKDGIINDKDKLHRVLTEIKIHRSLNNQYICKYEHSFEDKNSIYILMEYCEKKSLDDYLKSRKTLSEYETRFYMFQVLLALIYLRRQKVIHRDLTLANVFMKDYKTVKIGDFGLSYKETESEEKPGLMCGTQGYFTPESYTTKYSYKTDIFDFGVCIYHLMTGNTLFKDSVSSYETVRKGEILYDEKTKFSSEAKDLFRRIFVLENKRIDLDEIYIHDFFNEGKGLIDIEFPDFSKMAKKEFEDKIKALEAGVKMTNVSYFPRKNTLSKEENFPYMNKKSSSINEINQDANNKIRDLSINDTIKNNGLMSRKNVLEFKGKFSLNPESPQINDITNIKSSNNIFGTKRLRTSLKVKRDDDDENHNEKENNNKKRGNNKKLTFRLVDDPKDKKEKEKIIVSPIKEENDNNENNNNNDELLRNKLETNLEKLKKENNLETNHFFEHRGTFRAKDDLDIPELNFIKIKHQQKPEVKIIDKNDNIENIYITRVIEVSEKYGIGYELSNNDIGILFNDFSHITKFKDLKNLIYYRHNYIKKKIFLPLKDQSEIEDIENKVYFLGYIIDESKKNKFKKKYKNEYDIKNKKNNNLIDSKMVNENVNEEFIEDNVYLIKYKKTNCAYFFILSNKNIQISFFDGNKVIFSCFKNKKIIYINRHNEISNFELKNDEDFTTFKCENPKINKRIKYAIKEIKK